MKTIVFTAAAARQLDKLPEDARDRIDAALFAYATKGVGDVKRLQGMSETRLRVGEYRVVFEEGVHALHVRGIGNRKNVYR
jgi:mRNA interferase RelE/StbE